MDLKGVGREWPQARAEATAQAVPRASHPLREARQLLLPHLRFFLLDVAGATQAQGQGPTEAPAGRRGNDAGSDDGTGAGCTSSASTYQAIYRSSTCAAGQDPWASLGSQV